MNLNKALLHFKNRYSKLALLGIYDSCLGSRALYFSTKYFGTSLQRKSNDELWKHYKRKGERKTACHYSSAANEEQVKVKKPCITVPTLNFEDLTFDSPIIHSELCKDLQICDSIDEQMLTLTSALSLSPDDIENRLYFIKQIESLLKPFFGNIKIQIFGSTLNGFGFKGCDIDMSFDTFTQENEKIEYIDIPDVPLVSEVLSGKVSPSEIALLPPKEQLIFIHSVLLEYYRESEEPPIFINAHIPLVRFHHNKLNLKCDLTCRNRVAYSNTKLLYLFGKLDSRVIPLMMTIRYWAKHVELIGKGLMFNTYTISLLVIHFLQTRNPPVLPSAEYILSISDSLQIEDMNDKSFLMIRSHIPPSENKQSLSELLRDFFFYYFYFDFTRVVCPLIGASVPREKFFSNLNSKKFRMNSICVQDPMLLTHNVAELVDYKHCKKLFSELMVGCNLFQNKSDLSPSPDKWGISLLLNKTDEYLPSNLYHQKGITLEVPLIKKKLENIGPVNDPKLFTAETLLYILRHIFLFECKTLEKDEAITLLQKHDNEIVRQKRMVEMKNECNSRVIEVYQKYKASTKHLVQTNLEKFDNALMLQEFQDFCSKNKLLLCAECKVSKNSWLGRDHISLESLPPDSLNNLLEKEHYISIHASRQNELNLADQKEKVKPFVFIFECYESPESSMLIHFRTFKKTNFNPSLGIFLKEYVPKIIQSLNEDC